MRTMYETGKLAQVTSDIKRYNLHILGISESTDRRGLEDSEPIQEKQCYSEEEMRGEDYRQSNHIEWKLVKTAYLQTSKTCLGTRERKKAGMDHSRNLARH